MFRHALLFLMLAVGLGLASAAPATEPKAEPAAPKTPASTEKLVPLIAPLPALAIPQIAVPFPFPALAYPYLGPFRVAAVPSTYTVEEHGYTITY